MSLRYFCVTVSKAGEKQQIRACTLNTKRAHRTSPNKDSQAHNRPAPAITAVPKVCTGQPAAPALIWMKLHGDPHPDQRNAWKSHSNRITHRARNNAGAAAFVSVKECTATH